VYSQISLVLSVRRKRSSIVRVVIRFVAIHGLRLQRMLFFLLKQFLFDTQECFRPAVLRRDAAGKPPEERQLAGGHVPGNQAPDTGGDLGF
jgi:hypothetical protein